MSKLDSVLSTRDIAFAAYIDHAMSEHKLESTEAQRESLYQAAEAFHSPAAGRAFLKSSKDAATAAQQRATSRRDVSLADKPYQHLGSAYDAWRVWRMAYDQEGLKRERPQLASRGA